MHLVRVRMEGLPGATAMVSGLGKIRESRLVILGGPVAMLN